MTSAREQYTIVILSQPRRLQTLKTVVAHYRHCPSVKEIVVVWNDEDVPDLSTNSRLGSDVPVRFRQEAHDSLNNRFKPDPLISTKAVLSLDDDTLLWCSDIEHGFREWRRQPDALVGFFPRLILVPEDHDGVGGVGRSVQYLGEREVFTRGEYNAVLTCAMFYHVELMKSYFAPETLFLRNTVDALGNCEDIAMNYVATAALIAKTENFNESAGELSSAPTTTTTAATATRFVRPHRRLDISKVAFAGGISQNTAAHLAKRVQCASYFGRFSNQSGFGPLELPRTAVTVPSPVCWIPFLGCVYL